jgi:acyl-CoA thioester hydrolase
MDERLRRARRRFEPEVTLELEVPFHDVDMLELVWHGHYYKYFELARTQLLRARGLTDRALRDSGYMLVVVESTCRHPGALRFGQHFRVGAALGSVEFGLRVDYQIWNLSDDRRAAYGNTVLAILDSSGKLLVRTPDALLDLLHRH